jgi:cell division protein YceG involved in septum cleavage
MNRVSDRRIEGNSYNQMNRRTLWMAGGLVLIVLVIFSVFFMTKTVTAQREGERYKQVISIEIKKGDTLWSIASEYMSEEYKDLNEYIEEIKDTNGMLTDEIHAGNYIIVPYYVDATTFAMAE